MASGLSSLKSLFGKVTPSSPSRNGVLGIDIGSSAIKIVQLREVRGVPTLETYGELQLGPYEGIDLGRGTHLPPQKVTEALIDILREAGATSKNVLFSIGYGSHFTSVIPIQSLDENSIPTMVPLEARKYIPVPLTKVSLDWSPVSINKEHRITNILISAIYTEGLNRYNTIMADSGLTTFMSEVEVFSSLRSALSPKDSIVAVLDFGASATRLCIIRKGLVSKMHSVLLSGVTLTHALEESLQIQFSEAEEIKRTVGMYSQGDDLGIAKVLTAGLERGIRELHTVLKKYEEGEQTNVDSVVITGSGALLLGLSEYIQQVFSKPVRIADPFSKVAYPVFLEDTLKQAGPTFAVAVGVALRAFQKNK